MTTPSPSFLEELLAEQQSLTAVERFSRAHDEQHSPQARLYRDLIPLEAPKPGEQYAFEVELDKCSGCKACVTACHSLNGLDDNETWRDVGLLVSPPSKPWKPTPVIQQTITTACHHCVDPACLNGCPVLAYEKDPITGIVRHLDDQCIGCQYCVLKCPYDVPKYNDRLGIVRKCDMCSSRLAVGEAPACVQACPNEAIRITKVNTTAVAIEFRQRGKNFLIGAPAGDYTLPTTRYTGDSTPYLRAADATELKPQPAHWPLVIMLVLSQASVGVVTVAAGFRIITFQILLVALALGVGGLGASVFHLGRPFGAWRAFLNLKRSWMSREIVVFGAYMPLLSSAVAALFINKIEIAVIFSWAAGVVGLIGVFCSAMIYHDTQRRLWKWQRSVPLFFGTVVALGTVAGSLVVQSSHFPAIIISAVILKLMVEIHVLRHGNDDGLTPLKKTVLLLTGRFQPVTLIHLSCLMLGGICLPLLLTMNVSLPYTPVAAAAFTLLLIGELLERFLFFTTVSAPKMPGGLPT